MSQWIVRNEFLGIDPTSYAALMDDELREQLASQCDWKNEIVECSSSDGWSLHEPGSTEEEIASGNAPFLLCGGDETETTAPRLAWERAAQLAFLASYCRAHKATFGETFALR